MYTCFIFTNVYLLSKCFFVAFVFVAFFKIFQLLIFADVRVSAANVLQIIYSYLSRIHAHFVYNQSV